MLGRILPFRRASAAPAPAIAEPQGPDAAMRLGADDAERFRQSVLPHLDGAYGLARLLTRDATAAEDIVQEAFVRALRGFGGFRGSNPKAWLYAIVRNGFLTWAKSQGARAEAGPETLEQIADEQPSPEAVLLNQGTVDRVRAAVHALPEPFREALALRELDELSYREIAEITGAPIGTVMSRLARARQMLCAVLAIAGDEAEEAAG